MSFKGLVVAILKEIRICCSRLQSLRKNVQFYARIAPRREQLLNAMCAGRLIGFTQRSVFRATLLKIDGTAIGRRAQRGVQALQGHVGRADLVVMRHAKVREVRERIAPRQKVIFALGEQRQGPRRLCVAEAPQPRPRSSDRDDSMS